MIGPGGLLLCSGSSSTTTTTAPICCCCPKLSSVLWVGLPKKIDNYVTKLGCENYFFEGLTWLLSTAGDALNPARTGKASDSTV